MMHIASIYNVNKANEWYIVSHFLVMQLNYFKNEEEKAQLISFSRQKKEHMKQMWVLGVSLVKILLQIEYYKNEQINKEHVPDL